MKASTWIYHQKVTYDVCITKLAIGGSYVYPIFIRIDEKLRNKVDVRKT